ncbi:glycosyltransferase family 4 protein [Flavobacterium succinicans]|uniref:Putative glycosyl transferase n=1 Tax=Flavobacterium succinicans TaxID=29536 RepID=A0A199XMX5_9FLAO|nr:glycosyltransferase family 4 protein [Flavobacterium succinicans]OAZ03083.1 putative glycosyl transferase [Flavobacterium succinicans]
MVWIISELFYPDEVSTAQILTDIATKISEKQRVSILAGPVGYEKSYHSANGKLSEEIVIHRVSLPNFDKNNLLQRFLKLIFLTIKMSFFMFKNIKDGDRVIQVTNPIFLILTTAILRNLKKIKLEFLVHDVYPENMIPAGMIKKDSFKYSFLSFFFNKAFIQADRLIVLGEDMKQLMLLKTNQENQVIDVIPNWADDFIYPDRIFDKSDYLNQNVEGKIVLGFAGNIGRLQGVVEFISIFKKATNPNLVLTIIGDGAIKNEIEAMIEHDKISNVIVLGSKPRNEQLQFLNACDIGLITLKKGMKGLGVPSKTYNIMAAGKPILFIGDLGSEIDNYVKKYDCGWSFEWDEQEIVAFLNSLSIENSSFIENKGVQSVTMCKQLFSKDIVLEKF